MALDNKLCSLSIHPTIVGKPDDAVMRNSGRDWQAVENSEVELADWICGGGAYAPQYRGGHRKTANFVRSGFLAADVDAGMTLEEAKGHAFVQHHAALIHTTVSHTAEHHRFRIVFLLDEAIVEARDFADAQLGLALMLGADTAATDAARMFFGNTKAVVVSIGKTLPPDVVANLIARGRDDRASCSARGKHPWSVDSSRNLAGSELVKVAGGDWVRMDELGDRVPVHCPHHDDGDPSAFTLRSKKGHPGIHCMACKATFWSATDRDAYDFGAFDRLFAERQRAQPGVDADALGLDRFFPPTPRFLKYQTLYLPTLAYEPGITLVKSPKGSGKTEALLAMCAHINAGQFRADIARRDRPRSILLIGHRQALLREAAAKLGLRCYLNLGDQIDGKVRTLAVCLRQFAKIHRGRRHL